MKKIASNSTGHELSQSQPAENLHIDLQARELSVGLIPWLDPSRGGHDGVELPYQDSNARIAQGLLDLIAESEQETVSPLFMDLGFTARVPRIFPDKELFKPDTLVVLTKQPNHRKLVCTDQRLDRFLQQPYEWKEWKREQPHRTSLEVIKESLHLLLKDYVSTGGLVPNDGFRAKDYLDEVVIPHKKRARGLGRLLNWTS